MKYYIKDADTRSPWGVVGNLESAIERAKELSQQYNKSTFVIETYHGRVYRHPQTDEVVFERNQLND